MSEVSPGDRSAQRRARQEAAARRAARTAARTSTAQAGRKTRSADTPAAPVTSSVAKPSNETPSGPTGADVRQVFPEPSTNTGELIQQANTLSNIRSLYGRNADVRQEASPLLLDERPTMFHDDRVAQYYDAVRVTEAAEWADARITHMKNSAADARQEVLGKKRRGAAGGVGRPVQFPVTALLVGLLLTTEDGKGPLATEVAKTLYQRLYPTSQALLGLPALGLPGDARLTPREAARRREDRAEKRVQRAMHRLFNAVDPSVQPKNVKDATWTDIVTKSKNLTEEEIEDRMAALAYLCNVILQMPLELLPDSIRSRMQSAGIDGTPIKVWSRGRGKNATVAATDPDAGWYVRGGDHSEGSEPKKALFGYDINLMVTACDTPGDRQYLPALPLAMSLNRPGVDPSGAARRIFAFLNEKGFAPKYLAGDGLYANADPDKFMQPAREFGWKLVLPVLDANTGRQGTVGGYNLVEGSLYCPSMPETLVDATKDFRARRIDLPTYLTRIKERENYVVRVHSTRGTGRLRMYCPAATGKNIAVCSLKPDSANNATVFVGGIPNYRPVITPDPATQTNGLWPQPCRPDASEIATVDLRVTRDLNGNLTGPNVNAAKFWQDLPFGSPQHTNTYNAMRQSQEGMHGFAKDDAKEALGNPGRRRMRGIAAQSVLAAVLLAAASLRKIRTFLRNALSDDTGSLYVPRHKRTGEHATTLFPPGTLGTRGDPEYDEQAA